jgi:hypothetical protein
LRNLVRELSRQLGDIASTRFQSSALKHTQQVVGYF